MNISTTYMGMPLKSPIVVSACTLSEEMDNILKMEDSGAGAVVLFSLFEEQIKLEMAHVEAVKHSTSNQFAEFDHLFPGLDEFKEGSEGYLDHIRQAKERVDIPIIASLNGITNEGWIDYAAQIEEAGADALEINIFFIPGDVLLSGSAVEHRYLNILDAVKKTVKIPVAVKLNPYFSNTGNIALRMHQYGANALVLFNRFYQPDFDIHQVKILQNLRYSEANEIRLPLLWISALYNRVPIGLAANTGVQSANEVIKYLLAGADVAMTASILYKNGISYLHNMNHALKTWMFTHGYDTIDSFRGYLSQEEIADPTKIDRENYMSILDGWKR